MVAIISQRNHWSAFHYCSRCLLPLLCAKSETGLIVLPLPSKLQENLGSGIIRILVSHMTRPTYFAPLGRAGLPKSHDITSL